jgi:Activator of Hsp90 ATPase homolog 1-like protein
VHPRIEQVGRQFQTRADIKHRGAVRQGCRGFLADSHDMPASDSDMTRRLSTRRQWIRSASRPFLTKIEESRHMTEQPAGAWTRTSRVIRARPEELYAAFLDPTALVDWLPPAEMTDEVHEFDARVGGGYRMSLFYPPDEPSFGGKTPDGEDMVKARWSWRLPGGSPKPSAS